MNRYTWAYYYLAPMILLVSINAHSLGIVLEYNKEQGNWEFPKEEIRQFVFIHQNGRHQKMEMYTEIRETFSDDWLWILAVPVRKKDAYLKLTQVQLSTIHQMYSEFIDWKKIVYNEYVSSCYTLFPFHGLMRTKINNIGKNLKKDYFELTANKEEKWIDKTTILPHDNKVEMEYIVYDRNDKSAFYQNLQDKGIDINDEWREVTEKLFDIGFSFIVATVKRIKQTSDTAMGFSAQTGFESQYPILPAVCLYKLYPKRTFYPILTVSVNSTVKIQEKIREVPKEYNYHLVPTEKIILSSRIQLGFYKLFLSVRSFIKNLYKDYPVLDKITVGREIAINTKMESLPNYKVKKFDIATLFQMDVLDLCRYNEDIYFEKEKLSMKLPWLLLRIYNYLGTPLYQLMFISFFILCSVCLSIILSKYFLRGHIKRKYLLSIILGLLAGINLWLFLCGVWIYKVNVLKTVDKNIKERLENSNYKLSVSGLSYYTGLMVLFLLMYPILIISTILFFS